ncbi:MAG: Hsp20/alpha crystallin family protein [Planctomycetia bacterium]|nr:MAG: Hsp20/alpha crystallin family protein [Planctomycetia bacterium]
MLALGNFPIATLGDLHRQVDQAFANVMRGVGFDEMTSALPALVMWSDGEKLYAEAELPGLTIGDIEVSVVGNELSIRGQRKPITGDNLTFHRRERVTGEFVRIVTLPTPVDSEGVEATLRDGVLRIVMPKAAAARARKIAVKAG